MQIGIVGLGRMGGNMAARWRDRGHEVLGYSRTSPTATPTPWRNSSRSSPDPAWCG